MLISYITLLNTSFVKAMKVYLIYIFFYFFIKFKKPTYVTPCFLLLTAVTLCVKACSIKYTNLYIKSCTDAVNVEPFMHYTLVWFPSNCQINKNKRKEWETDTYNEISYKSIVKNVYYLMRSETLFLIAGFRWKTLTCTSR